MNLIKRPELEQPGGDVPFSEPIVSAEPEKAIKAESTEPVATADLKLTKKKRKAGDDLAPSKKKKLPILQTTVELELNKESVPVHRDDTPPTLVESVIASFDLSIPLVHSEEVLEPASNQIENQIIVVETTSDHAKEDLITQEPTSGRLEDPVVVEEPVMESHADLGLLDTPIIPIDESFLDVIQAVSSQIASFVRTHLNCEGVLKDLTAQLALKNSLVQEKDEIIQKWADALLFQEKRL